MNDDVLLLVVVVGLGGPGLAALVGVAQGTPLQRKLIIATAQSAIRSQIICRR